MDEIDRRITLRLQENGRESNADIARYLGISEATVRRRIKRLVGDGVIRVTAVPNPTKVGYEAVALLGLKVDLDKIDAAAEQLVVMSEVQYAAMTTGAYDIFILVMLPSLQELGSFIKAKLACIQGIKSSETFLNLETKKQTFGWIT